MKEQIQKTQIKGIATKTIGMINQSHVKLK